MGSVFRTLVARGVYSLDLQPAETKLNTYRKKQRSKIIFDKPEIFFVQDYGRTKFHIVSSA